MTTHIAALQGHGVICVADILDSLMKESHIRRYLLFLMLHFTAFHRHTVLTLFENGLSALGWVFSRFSTLDAAVTSADVLYFLLGTHDRYVGATSPQPVLMALYMIPAFHVWPHVNEFEAPTTLVDSSPEKWAPLPVFDVTPSKFFVDSDCPEV
jgi:hypothetical protein